MKNLFKELQHDLPASIVVFFVAVPLCLGVALASGAPLFSGIIAGIIGGIVVGGASGSALGVSGPAAGLAVIVLNAIGLLGSYEAFLLAVVFAGVLQIIMGYLKLGLIAHYFPSAVIKGMLAGIGVIIVLKQIPHAIGYHVEPEGNLDFLVGNENTFSIILKSLETISPAALLISFVSLTVLLLWELPYFKNKSIFKFLQGPVLVVLLGILFNYLFKTGLLPLSLTQEQMVSIPVSNGLKEFAGQFTLPDFSMLLNPQVYTTALLLALIASLETLLSVEAADKIDPYKRVTPTAKELKAQGLGNLISGMIGGLPITQVIVRTSANVSFGGRTKMSTILHGVFILLSALLIPNVLNMIPLATLACILLVVGYKLAKPQLFKAMYKMGLPQFIPFLVTIVAIVFTDLLKGIFMGMVVAIFYILRGHYMNSYEMEKTATPEGKSHFRVNLAEEVTFLNKGSLMKALNDLPRASRVTIDGSKSRTVDYDIIEVIRSFLVNSTTKDIEVNIIALPTVYEHVDDHAH